MCGIWIWISDLNGKSICHLSLNLNYVNISIRLQQVSCRCQNEHLSLISQPTCYVLKKKLLMGKEKKDLELIILCYFNQPFMLRLKTYYNQNSKSRDAIEIF